MDPDATTTIPPSSSSSSPSIFRWTIGFLLVGFAWGFTTPFMRRAALEQQREHKQLKRKQQHQKQASNTEDENDGDDDDDDDDDEAPLPPPSSSSSSAQASMSTDPRARLDGNKSSSSSSYIQILRGKIHSILTSVLETLRRPAYAVPLLVNVTGSVWFFLLVGQAELSLTVPITNSLAFLFTVLGEWFAEGKVISKNTWLGMSLVLVGIALCVHSKL